MHHHLPALAGRGDARAGSVGRSAHRRPPAGPPGCTRRRRSTPARRGRPSRTRPGTRSNDGSVAGPTCIVTEPSTAATAALEVDVPIARSRAFSPFAEAVSVIGTDAMISVGIAA